MKFRYTALGPSNQRLEGVLDAESIDAAREQLHKMGLSVVAINEVSPEEAAEAEKAKAAEKKAEEGITTYYFLALDPQKKEVNGTIDSKDAYLAYRRLLTEYGFEVLDLYPQDASDPAAESLKSKFEEWKKQMEEEGVDLTKKPKVGVKAELEEEGEKLSEEIVAEIDKFIINTKKVLEQHRDQYSDEFLREIEKTLNELERIRASTNLKHITKVCNTLYELISNPDAITAEGEAVEKDYVDTLSKLKDSGFIANRFQFLKLHNLQKRAMRFEKVQTILVKISKALHRKKAAEIEENLTSKLKNRRARWLSQLTRSLKEKGEAHPTILGILSKFFTFIKAPNLILRRARKQDMLKAINEWKEYRKQAKIQKKEKVLKEAEIMEEKPKKDFSGFYMELDSFVGWLLFFYISYFFLVSFAIERNVGLPKELVLKTLSTPLIINISIFLIVAHLTLTFKLRFFRSNFLGSLFLFFLCFGIYSIVIINF